MNSSNSVKQAIVLVGGLGTRLRPLTLNRPKQMLPVAHKPMIELVLSQLYRAGITNAVLALGYKPDAFIQAYPDGMCAGVKLAYAVESEPLDTAGAIKFAIQESKTTEETFLAVNGDVICEADLTELVSLHFEKQGTATLLSTKVKDPSQFGVLKINENSEVLAFYEKPDPNAGLGNSINAGMYVLNAEILDRIPEGSPCSIEKDIFPELVGESKLFACISDKYWIDAGTPQSYLQVQLDMAGRNGVGLISPSAEVADSAQVDLSLLGEGVRIMEGAKIKGSVILDHSIVGADAHIENSILGHSACIGEGAKLTDLCVVGDDGKIAPGQELAGQKI